MAAPICESDGHLCGVHHWRLLRKSFRNLLILANTYHNSLKHVPPLATVLPVSQSARAARQPCPRCAAVRGRSPKPWRVESYLPYWRSALLAQTIGLGQPCKVDVPNPGGSGAGRGGDVES